MKKSNWIAPELSVTNLIKDVLLTSEVGPDPGENGTPILPLPQNTTTLDF